MAGGGYEIVCNSCGEAVPSDNARCFTCGALLLGAAAPPPLPALTQLAAQAAPGQLVLEGSSWAQVETSQDIGTMRYGGFWIRLLAWGIDFLVTAVPVALAQTVPGLLGLALSLAVLLYYPILESSVHQGTLGKKACGLFVTDSQGRRISFGRAVLRYVAKFISALTLGLGFVLIAFSARKRGLHDLMVDTLVLRR
jgi:uncharacterized RDD family membrane protein YckC